MPPTERTLAENENTYGPGSAAGVPASFQYVATPIVVPLSVRRTRVQPAGAAIVVLLPPRTEMAASMTSFWSVPAGRAMLMLLAFTPLVAAARNEICAP